MRKIIIFLVLAGLLWPDGSFCLDEELVNKLTRLKWIAYAPTNFNPQRHCYPEAESIRADLIVLKNAGFEGIVTYSSENSLALIPGIARELGFAGVIMGIWSPNKTEEIDNAIKQRAYVDGYCVGNEGYNIRYDIRTLKKAINFVRSQSQKPATTTEQINDYFFNRDLIEVGDWVFPSVHPFLYGMRKPKFASSWTQDRYRCLKSHIGDVPILFKESGYPTGGGLETSEEAQEAFFSLLEKTDVPFVYFEAFDQPWKRHLRCESHWGLFDKDRNPKNILEKESDEIVGL